MRLTLLLNILKWLPAVVYYAFSDLLRFTAIYVLRYRKEVIISNLKRSFPDQDEKTIRRIAKRQYANFCDVLIEPLVAYGFQKKHWEKRVQLMNYEPMREYLNKGTSVILVAGHTANWEWGGFAIGSRLGFPLEFLYKPIKNEGVGKLMLALRLKHAERAIDKDKAMRELVKRRHEPRLLAFVTDQMPALGTEKKWTDFLGQKTAFYLGAERAATTFQYPVFYADVVRTKRGYYKVELTELSAPPYQKGENAEITEKFASRLEQSIYNNPHLYLWSHRRWKYTQEEETAILAAQKATRS